MKSKTHLYTVKVKFGLERKITKGMARRMILVFLKKYPEVKTLNFNLK